IGWGRSYLSKIFFVWQAARKAKQLHKTYQFDGAWAMMLYMLFPIALARLPIPYALTIQEGDPYEHVFERWYIKPFSFLLSVGLSGAAVVQTISTYLAQWAERNHYKGPI